MTDVFCKARLAMERSCREVPAFADGYCPKHHAKDLRLKRAYGVSLVQMEYVLDIQKWICPVGQELLSGNDAWVTDHDHKLRLVRGALCRNCNHRVVGRHTDGELLIRAGWYIRVPPAPRVLGHMATVPKRKRKPRKKITPA